MSETLKAQPISRPRTAHKGFSLVELVIAILIIAVLVAAVFAGGSIIIKNAQISRTTSDLHNFSIAVESWMNQNPTIANVRNNESYKKDTALYNSFNALLAEDYKLEDTANTSNITAVQAADGGDYYIYRSKKTDAWGNAYYVVFTDQGRSDLEGTKHSEFFVEVISAGPNAKAKIGGTEDKIDDDDIFLVGQYTDGNVVSKIYNYDDDKPVDDSGVAATSYTDDAKAPIATKATTTVSAPSTLSTPADLTGTTWILNIPQFSGTHVTETAGITFTSNNNQYNCIRITSGTNPSILKLFMEEEPYGTLVQGYVDGMGWGSFVDFGGDIQDFNANDNCRIITITGGPSVTNTDLIAWLEANATRIS